MAGVGPGHLVGQPVPVDIHPRKLGEVGAAAKVGPGIAGPVETDL